MIKWTFFLWFFFLASCSSLRREGAEIPDIYLLKTDSTTIFTTKSIPMGQPFVVAYFSADCRLCQEETKEWVENMNRMKHLNFYFITNSPIADVRTFETVMGVDKLSNVMVGLDIEREFRKWFHPSMLPYVVVFDKTRKARIAFSGGVKSTDLLEKIDKIIEK